jgi:hypothetical protein
LKAIALTLKQTSARIRVMDRIGCALCPPPKDNPPCRSDAMSKNA